MLLRISFLLLSFVVALGLSACGGGTGTGSVTSNQNNTTVQQQPEKPKELTQLEKDQLEGGAFQAFTKTLQNGKVVQCVGVQTYHTGAVTCDFANAK